MSDSTLVIVDESPSARVPAPTTLRDRLRAATAVDHRALEDTALMRAVADGVPGADDYARYLACQWQLHQPLEAALAPQLPPDWGRERLVKTAWLEQDLHALGKPLPEPYRGGTPPTGAAAALGVLYVLEGATLGLHVVTRRLPADHPAFRGAGRFMAAYGAQTGPRWNAFLRVLGGVPAVDWAAATNAAVATFAAFLDVFDSARPCGSAR